MFNSMDIFYLFADKIIYIKIINTLFFIFMYLLAENEILISNSEIRIYALRS